MPQTVIGLAIDVSGSMQESFGSDAEERVRAVWRSLGAAADEAATMRARDGGEPLLFAYLFGLRRGEVADLVAVSSLTDLDPARIARAEGLTDWYTEAKESFQPPELLLLASALQRRPECGERLRELLPQKPSSDRLFTAPIDAYRVGKAVVTGRTNAAIHYAQVIVRQEADWLQCDAERTLPLSKITRVLRGGPLDNTAIRELIFGGTPMVHVLTRASKRFAAFRDARKRLVMISDGEPTDGDPEPIAAQLRAAGVAIVSCFIAPADVLEPRVFPTTPRLRRIAPRS